MTALFEKEITTTADDYRSIVRFTEYRLKKLPKITMISCFLLCNVAVILGLFGIIPFPYWLIVGALFVLAAAYFPIKVAVTVKNGIKYGKVAINTKRKFSLDTVGIRLVGGRTGTNISAPWETLFAVYEINECFLIYFRHDSVFCIAKNQLTLPQVTELRNHFIKRLGQRFFRLCKI